MNATWTLYKALDTIKQLQGINAHSYYIALAGSVLNQGYSTNDLDLVIYPEKEITTPYLPAIQYIIDTLKPQSYHLQLFPEKEHKLVYFLMLAGNYVINIFIPNKDATMQETNEHFIRQYKAY